jgi:hypothetical protein
VIPLRDPDIWWHLENGRQMLAQQTLLPLDGRSFTMPPVVRVNPSWLWDLLAALVHQSAGVEVLLLLPSLITIAILALGLLATPAASRPAMAIAGLLLVPVLVVRANPRPDTLAPLLILCVLVALQRDKTRPRNILGALLVSTLWVQLHASFLLALPAAMFFLLVRGWQRRDVWVELSVVGGVGLGCLLHPSGAVTLLRTVLGQLNRDTSSIQIMEWGGFQFTSLLTWPNHRHALLLLAFSTALAVWRSKHRSWALLMMAGFLLLATVKAQRIGPVAATSCWFALSAMTLPPVPPRWMLSGTLVLLLVQLRLMPNIPGLTIPSLERPPLLTKTLNAIPTTDQPRNILNWFDIGAIITWDHGQHWRVSIDPRAELGYDQDAMLAVSDTFSHPQAWQRFTQQHHIDAVVAPQESPLCRGLLLDQTWQSAGSDGDWAVFVRAGIGADLPTIRLNPCDTVSNFIDSCKANPQLVEAATQAATQDQSSFSAQRAAMGAFVCSQDPEAAMYWADEAVQRDPRNLKAYKTRLLIHQTYELSPVADRQMLWWFVQ